MEEKICKFCNKIFTKEQYPKNFGSRKYCSNDCAMRGFIEIGKKNKIKNDIKSSINSWKTPHGEKLLKINSIINGNLIGAKIIVGTYEPDIIKEDYEIELHQLYNSNFTRYPKKFQRPRFDNKQPKERILIISCPKEVLKYFNKILVYESPYFEEEMKKVFDGK